MVWKLFSYVKPLWPWPTFKSIGIILHATDVHVHVFSLEGDTESKLWCRNPFLMLKHGDLHLWQFNPKIKIRFKSISKFSDRWYRKQVMLGKHFLISEQCDLELWRFDPKINRDHPWLSDSTYIQNLTKSNFWWHELITQVKQEYHWKQWMVPIVTH